MIKKFYSNENYQEKLKQNYKTSRRILLKYFIKFFP